MCAHAEDTNTHRQMQPRRLFFWFQRILKVENTDSFSSIPCRKSYFYLGWRCFAGFQLFTVLHTTVGTDGKQKKKRRKRQLSLWQNPNWNAKWYSEDNGEERCWNQMFTLKGTLKSLLRMEQADVRWSQRCNFNPRLLLWEPLAWLLIFDYEWELPSCRQRLTPIPFHLQHNRARGLTRQGVAVERSNTYGAWRNVKKRGEKSAWIKTSTKHPWLFERQKMNADKY